MTIHAATGIKSYENFDIRMTWLVAISAGSTAIAGELRNIRYAMMENIEVRVTLLDAKGEKVGQGTDFIAGRLTRDERTPFSITLPAAAAPGSRLAFTYKYHGDETAWQQSFEAELAA